jgi:hypothetical protein
MGWAFVARFSGSEGLLSGMQLKAVVKLAQ